MACTMPTSLDSFKKNGNRDLKMPYERKKVETFAIDARNRITSGLQKYVNIKSNRNWNGICTKIVRIVVVDAAVYDSSMDKHTTQPNPKPSFACRH